MNFGERVAARKRSKELKNEIKELRKELLKAGGDKAQVTATLKELQDAMELASTLHSDYEDANLHLNKAREAIVKLLDCMGVSPEAEVQQSMNVLISDLEQVYHDCSIREDDLDFQSTIRCLKEMISTKPQPEMVVGTYGMQAIMVRSELENIKAVLDDTAGWRAPDFFALAYYFLHDDRNNLKEMENEQRNQFVLSYLNEYFMDDFMRSCEKAGIKERVQTFMQGYI